MKRRKAGITITVKWDGTQRRWVAVATLRGKRINSASGLEQAEAIWQLHNRLSGSHYQDYVGKLEWNGHGYE